MASGGSSRRTASVYGSFAFGADDVFGSYDDCHARDPAVVNRTDPRVIVSCVFFFPLVGARHSGEKVPGLVADYFKLVVLFIL